MAEKDPLIYTTPIGRLSWPALFTPEENTGDDGTTKSQYACTLIIPKTYSDEALQALAQQVAKEKWGAKLAQYAPDLKKPIKDGIKKADIPGYGPDVWFIKAVSKYRPDVKDAQLHNIIDEALVYPGANARMVIKPYAYEYANRQGVIISRGVSFNLFAVQVTGGGEPFGSVVDPDDYLTPIGDAIASNPTAQGQGGYSW